MIRLFLFLVLVIPCFAGDPPTGVEPSAPELLNGVWSRFPTEPVRITGELQVRDRHGRMESRWPFELEMDWNLHPRQTRYTVRDTSNRVLEQLTLLLPEGRGPQYRYARGDPPVEEPVPDLSAHVQNTDLSWTDLSLSFLWWPDATVAGTDTAKGRDCYVVQIPVPAGQTSPYHRVGIWIDRELGVLLQVEGYDVTGERVRRLWIQSFKKINDRWMIKDMEVETYPGLHKTRLRVKDLQVDGAEIGSSE